MSEALWQSNGDHPPPGTVTLYLEGELEGREAAELARHLQDCWECRANCERVQRGVYAYMNYRDQVLLPSVPPPSPNKNNFYRRLEDLAALQGRQPTLYRVFSFFQSLPAIQRGRAGWIAATISAGIFFALYLFPVAHPRLLTGAELLHRAVISERSSRPDGRQFVYQKVRIKRGSRTLDREIYSDALRTAVQASTVDPELGRVFAEANIDWNMPLSAERFSAWRVSQSPTLDSIEESKDRVTLRTSSVSAGPILSASLTVRQVDWSAVAERIEFRSEPTLEITQLAYELRTLPLAESIADPGFHNRSASPRAATESPSVAIEAQLENAETLVREASHRIGADVQEMPEIRREGEVIRFRAFAENEQRRDEILAAANIPLVRAEVSDPEHPAVSDGGPESPSQTVPSTPLYTTDPPLAKALWDYFGSMNSANEYLSNLRDAYLQVFVETSALRELSERYPPRVLEGLPPESQQRIAGIAGDHLSVIQSRSAEYLKLLSPVLADMAQREKLPLVPERSAAMPDSCTAWQSFAPTFADNLRDLQTSFRRLFVIDQTDAPITLSAESLLFQSAEARFSLKRQLEALCPLHR